MNVAPISSQQQEARVMLAFFTEAPDGEGVLDGAGVVWRKFGNSWVSAESRSRSVPSEVLARALCPDLAEWMTS
ncbi:hypothetical protein AB0O14_05920 [Microbacterium foliorum]